MIFNHRNWTSVEVVYHINLHYGPDLLFKKLCTKREHYVDQMNSMKIHEWKVQKGGEKSVVHFTMLFQLSPEGTQRK